MPKCRGKIAQAHSSQWLEPVQKDGAYCDSPRCCAGAGASLAFFTLGGHFSEELRVSTETTLGLPSG